MLSSIFWWPLVSVVVVVVQPLAMFGSMLVCIPGHFSCVQLFATLLLVARRPPLFLGFSRQQYETGLPWPLPEDLHDPGIEPMSLITPALANGFFTLAPPGKPKQTSNLRNINSLHWLESLLINVKDNHSISLPWLVHMLPVTYFYNALDHFQIADPKFTHMK